MEEKNGRTTPPLNGTSENTIHHTLTHLIGQYKDLYLYSYVYVNHLICILQTHKNHLTGAGRESWIQISK